MQEERGILTVPGAKIGLKFPDEITDLKRQFSRDDENSRQLPRMKDYVTIKNNDGEKLRVQERLVYCNFKELF